MGHFLVKVLLISSVILVSKSYPQEATPPAPPEDNSKTDSSPPIRRGPPRDTLILGTGVMLADETEIYNQIEKNWFPFPMLSLSYNDFAWYGPRILYTWRLYENWEIIPQIQYSFHGWKAKRGTPMEGMAPRKDAFEIQGGLNFRLGEAFKIISSLMIDPLGVHGGSIYLVGGEWGFGFPGLPFIRMKITATFERWSSSFANYYYGVPTHEAGPQRGSYVIENPYVLGGQFSVNSPLINKMRLMSSLGYKHFNSQISHSPTLKTNYQWRYSLGVIYSFY